MSELNATLKQLVIEACAHPVGSWQRQRCFGQIYRLVTRSKKLWRESTPYYGDALQEMWEYCLQNLEEYDPSISQVTTWLDNRLKKRLRYHRDVSNRNKSRKQTPFVNNEGVLVEPVDGLEARTDVQLSLDLWQQTLDWLKRDPDGVLRETCFRKRPEINAQVIIARRLPPDVAWVDIAQEFQLNEKEAKDLPKWYNRHCLPKLKKFGRSQGYIR